MTAAELVATRRIVICVGGGGVGKTTIAAALALGAARAGRRTLVVTIDSARRLASALGLTELGDEARTIAPRLDAMMLERKRAWDRLIARHAGSEAARERILANRLYRDLSETFAGAHEYLALEEVAQASSSGRHELVVVDTPPARHAFELLTAPSRVRGVLDRRFARWLGGARGLLAPLASAAGPLEDLGDFLGAMEDLFTTFAARAGAARELLAAPGTSVVLVAGPDARGMADAREHLDHLRALELAAALVVVNRSHPPIPTATEVEVEAAARRLLDAGAPSAWLAANYPRHLRAAASEAARVEGLQAGAAIALVPRLREDVHDLPSLGRVARALGV